MRRRYIQVPVEPKDTIAALMTAGVVAACVGAVTFYLTRTLLAREPLADAPHRPALPPGEDEPVGGGA